MPINFAIKLGVMIATEALQVGLQASKRTSGPRLDELTVTTADFGTPLPRFLGARKFACSVFHAEDLKEVQKSTKVKGAGKQTSYHYLATFACAISDCQIDKVLRIWFDDTLIYDATGTGPISYSSTLGFDLASVMRVYKGTEDQLPDPRYTSWCEDKYGPNSAPPYRGVSYLLFEELPVDNFGNRIPQITVLATAAAVDAFPYQDLTTAASPGGGFAFSTSWLAYWNGAGGGIEWWDVATRTLIGSSFAGSMTGTMSTVTMGPDGTAYFVADFQEGASAVPYFVSVAPLGVPLKTPVSGVSNLQFDVSRYVGGAVYTTYDSAAGYIAGSAHVSGDSARDFCEDANGAPWGLFHPVGASSTFTIANLATGASHSFTGTSRSGPSAAYICYVASTNSFFVSTDGNFYIISASTWAITSSGAAGLSWGIAYSNAEQKPELTTAWQGFAQYSLTDGSLIRTLSASSWIAASYAESGFDPVNAAIWARTSALGSTTIRVLYLDRASNGGTTLGAIVSKMCDAAGLADRDTSLLTQQVAGYSWTRGDVKSQMEPVLDIHDVDARPHDFTIGFLPRGSASSGTILTQDFAKNGDTPRYTITETQDTDLPIMLRVNFADTGFDQQTNNVLSPLPTDSVDSQRDDTIDLTTYAATPDEAQQLADRYMRREWNGKDSVDLSLTAQELAIEPGDVKTLSLDGIAWTGKLEKQTMVGSRMDCTFRRDETAVSIINSATTGPVMQGRDPGTISFPAPIRGLVIDAPYREDSDADVRPLVYAGAGTYGQLAFPGAAIYEATGTGTSLAYDTLLDAVVSGATWGTCNDTLANADPNLWDRGNSLTVTLQGGGLTNASEADIDADPMLNLLIVGAEYVNFTTATLNGDGSYTLSDFKRGRRGTEWACGSHAAAEAWVLASSLDTKEMGSSDVGAALSFKAQSAGRTLDTALAIDMTYSGATLKPYAPARIKWTTDGTDLFGEIIRRTRIGGAWVGGSTIPLSESSEAYEVDVYHSTTLKRTISVSGTNLFTYTAAMMSADGNSVSSAPPVNVYQMSDAVGRGFALAA